MQFDFGRVHIEDTHVCVIGFLCDFNKRFHKRKYHLKL